LFGGGVGGLRVGPLESSVHESPFCSRDVAIIERAATKRNDGFHAGTGVGASCVVTHPPHPLAAAPSTASSTTLCILLTTKRPTVPAQQ
jgi:hypothetical protein